MIAKLSIGTHHFDFSNLDSELLTESNLKKAISSFRSRNYHTSIEDLNLKIKKIDYLFSNVKHSVDFLNFDEFHSIAKTSPIHSTLLYRLGSAFPQLTDRNDLIDAWIKATVNQETKAKAQRTKPPLWIAGCSMSSAVGVNDDQRWSHLLAEELDLEEVNLAYPGQSIWYSADQLLRSDIRKGDIVVWQLTATSRVNVIENDELVGVPIKKAIHSEICNKYFTPEWYGSDTKKILDLRYIAQVQKVMEKIGARLYLVNMMADSWINRLLDNDDAFLTFNKLMYKDLGTDKQHPGPLQHQEYAKQITKVIQGEQL